VTFDVARGTCGSVVADNGEGKTELLLTLAGRMRPTSGTLEVGGYPVPRRCAKVRRRSGLGFFEHVNEVQPVLTVENVVAAELNLHSRRSGRKAVRAFMEEWGLLGSARKKIEALDRFSYVRLGIVLGLAGDPELLVVDDIESDLTCHQSLKLMRELCDLAHDRDMTVVVACTDYDLAVFADEALPISESARAQARAVHHRNRVTAGLVTNAYVQAQLEEEDNNPQVKVEESQPQTVQKPAQEPVDALVEGDVVAHGADGAPAGRPAAGLQDARNKEVGTDA
jgi:ABC-type cobalamin/Fe3+-siderophores transport system ATPase subunit